MRPMRLTPGGSGVRGDTASCCCCSCSSASPASASVSAAALLLCRLLSGPWLPPARLPLRLLPLESAAASSLQQDFAIVVHDIALRFCRKDAEPTLCQLKGKAKIWSPCCPAAVAQVASPVAMLVLKSIRAQ